MPTFEFVRDEQGNETLVQVPDFVSGGVQDPDDVQPDNPDVLGPDTSIINEIALFANSTGDELKQSDVLITDKDLIGLHKLTVGDSTNVGEICIYSETDDLINIKGPPNATPYTLTLPVDDGKSGEQLTTDGSGILSWAAASLGGDVSGPASATDSAIALFDTTTGKLIKNSVLVVNSEGDMTRQGAPYIHESGGDNNFAAATNSLASVTSGFRLTSVGHGCLAAITDEDESSGFGYQCLNSCTAFAQTAFGSRCMANQTTAIQNSGFGYAVLASNISGSDNSIFGFNAGTNIINSNNTAVGSLSLVLAGGTSQGNSVLGSSGLSSMTQGNFNISIGDGAGGSHVTGDNNIYLAHVGSSSESNQIYIGTTGTHVAANIAGIINTTDNILITAVDSQTNTKYGYQTLRDITSAEDCVAIGDTCLPNIEGGSRTVGIGSSAGLLTKSATDCILIGYKAMSSPNMGATRCIAIGTETLGGSIETSPMDVVAIGYKVMTESLDLANQNVTVGNFGMTNVTTATRGCGYGHNNLLANLIGDDCCAYGHESLLANTGSSNIAIGSGGGKLLTTGDNNLCISNEGVAGNSDTIRIGTSGTHTATFLAGVKGVTPSGGSDEMVIMDTNGQMGTQVIPESSAQMSTGVVSGGLMSIDVDDTEFSITDGSGFIRNPVTDVLTAVNWSGLSAQSTSYSGFLTFVSINSGATVSYSTTEPTNAELRDEICIGILGHPNAVNLAFVEQTQLVIENSVNSLHDFMEALGPLNMSGNVVSAAQTDLSIAKTAGTMIRYGTNYFNDPKNPHVVTLAAINTDTGGDTYNLAYQDSSSRFVISDIIPAEYDDGNGEGSPGTVSANNWQVQRIYMFSAQTMVIQPGQFVYGTASAATNSIFTEGFVTQANNASDAILVGFLVVRGGATDISDSPSDATFLRVNKFGAISN